MAEFKRKLIGYVVGFGLLLIGFYDYCTNHTSNHCLMTYMFERIQYVPVKLEYDVTVMFPKYKLFVYGEGLYAQKLAENVFLGIPVLFIPGNAGSYKQVRSLGSVSYKMSAHTAFHFNYFAVDFSEEYSGLYGGVLQGQTEFVHECIKRILQLYKSSSSQPSSVILVGHSMGGTIARALYTLSEFDPNLVKLIIMQASPLKPTVMFDSYTREFYEKVGDIWSTNRSTHVGHVNVLSVGGGYRDILVRSWLTAVPQKQSYVLDLNLFTTAIPGVWISTDHNGIVWCKQLVLTITRAMFDLVNPATRQIYDDSFKRADILHYHLVRKTSNYSYEFVSKFNREIRPNPMGMWTENKKSAWTYIQNKVVSQTYIAVPIRRDGIMIVLAKNAPLHGWLFVCTADVGGDKAICTKGEVLGESRLTPSPNDPRKLAVLNLQDWRPSTHAVLHVQPHSNPVELFVEIYDPQERHQVVSLPWLFKGMFIRTKIVQRTSRQAIFYKFILKGMSNLWQAYNFHIIPSGKKCESEKSAFAKFHVPWNTEDIYTYINPKISTTIVVKMQTPKPGWISSDPELQLYLDPHCTYHISISYAVSDSMGQVIRFYVLLLPVLVVAILIEALSMQLYIYLANGNCPSLHSVLSVDRIFWKVAFISHIIMFVTRSEAVVQHLPFLPNPEKYSLETGNMHLSLIIYFLFALAVVLVKLLACIFMLPVGAIGRIISYVLYKYLLKEPGEVKFRQQNSVYVPVALSVGLVLCSLLLCGSLALVFGLVLFLYKVSYLQGKLESASIRGRNIHILSFSSHIYFTLMLLWFVTCALSIPSLLAWGSNLKYKLNLEPDPSLYPSSLLCISLMALWPEEGTRLNKTFGRLVAGGLYLLAVGTVCIGTEVLYLTNIFVTAAVVLIAVLEVIGHKQIKSD